VTAELLFALYWKGLKEYVHTSREPSKTKCTVFEDPQIKDPQKKVCTLFKMTSLRVHKLS
jgi:hypothetical protein